MRKYLFLLIGSLALHVYGQNPQDSVSNTNAALPNIPVKLDTLPDAMGRESALQNTPQNSTVSLTINFNAQDSMFFDMKKNQLTLFGKAHIDYGEIALDAEKTSVDWNKSTLKSSYERDSTGKKIGQPIFTDRGDVYQTHSIIYNFKSRKAEIVGVVTEQDGAFMHGEKIKKNEVNEMFIQNAKYTTCDLEEPHFYIKSKQLKVIPGNKVVSGPFYLQFGEIPTPLAGPFGMFPQPKRKASGIVVPIYGEEQRRGFFLRGGGYYFALNDYMDLKITGDIYTKGGYGLNVYHSYIKRYKFNGSFSFSYTHNVMGTLVNKTEQNTYWVNWNHSPITRGNSRFSASASFGSSSYNANNNLAINPNTFQRSVQANYRSNISYSTRFRGTPYNLSSNISLNQNIQSGIVNLTLPEVTLNMARIYPLKRWIKNSKSPLAKLNLSHTMLIKNELSNAPKSDFGFEVQQPTIKDTLVFNGQNLPAIYRRSRLGARHSIPLSTSFTLLKYFTVSPNFSYTEVWYLRQLQFSDYEKEKGGVKVDTVQGFTRAGSWRSGASLNTRLFGTYKIGSKKIQAIRHVMTPSLSFSYNPDFSSTQYGVYRDVVIDSLGNTRKLSKYEGFIFGSPQGSESQSLSFSMTNNLEMKVLDKNDSTEKTYKNVKIFDNFSISTGYNFAADSFKLSTISLNARTTLFKGKVSIATSATIDPYVYKIISRNENGIINQRKLDRYAWNNGKGLGSVTNFSTSINVNFRGKGRKKEAETDLQRQRPMEGNMGNQNEMINQEWMQNQMGSNPLAYLDFDVPWSLSTSYRISRSQIGYQPANLVQSITFSGSIGLTPKTQVTFNSGYDFDAKDFTTTRISVSRDLHCWAMSFNWVPFGTFQSYMITIQAKSSLLRDLKLEKRRSFQDFFAN